MNKPKFIFLGATEFSKNILLHLIANNYIPEIVFGIPENFHISWSDKKVTNCNYSDLSEICKNYKIAFYEVESGCKTISDFEERIQALNLDVILVMGWYYILPGKIRACAKYGAWGIHASLLPAYAGGAPLVWAIINGEKETGVTLFRLDAGVDDGDIISQKVITIRDEDSIREVYVKVTEESEIMLMDALDSLPEISFIPQNKAAIQVYAQRKPDDGEIDLSRTATELYNFIRAQSSPYPGAFIRTVDGKKLIIEKARIQSD